MKYKVGDFINLDCGYGPHSDDRDCEILEIRKDKDVWGNPTTSLKVRIPGTGEEFWTTV